MSGQGHDDNGVEQPLGLRLNTTPALASIKYNDIIAQDKATSSDDEPLDAPEIPLDDAQAAISVSINHEQTRLTSPKTPAVEKAAVIEEAGGFFGGGDGAKDTLVEEPEDDEEEEDTEGHEALVKSQAEIRAVSPMQSPVRLPSPWRVESKARWQTGSKTRSGLFDGIFNRRRASSGPEGASSESWQKSILASLPSLPNPFSMGLPFASQNDGRPDLVASNPAANTGAPLTPRSTRPLPDRTSRLPTNEARRITPSRAPQAVITFDDARKQLSPEDPRLRSATLRRSTSDTSLTTMRTLSIAESLGDDSRFEDVQNQVNSRLKAIKDSWQDSNIRLPSLPSFNVSSFTPDFFRERSGSLNRRQGVAQPSSENREAMTSRPRNHSTYAQQPDPMTRQPYSSAKDAVSDMSTSRTNNHPHFSHALEQLEGDIVVLGGYRGSILRSAEPPHRQMWVPVKVGLNLRKVNLEVGFDEGDDAKANKTVISGGMLTHIGPVDIARRLLKRLRGCRNVLSGKLRVHEYGYDWRLDPHYLSDGLLKFIEELPCNRNKPFGDSRGATVVAHSLGGLITRHTVNRRPDLFRGVVYAGVPYTCVNILGPLRNGDEVLLSDRVLTAQVNFSIRTSFALLPLDGRCFFDKNTKEEFPVDFFDPQTWVDYKLSPCVARPLPPLVAPPKPSGIGSYVSSMANALPSLPERARRTSVRPRNPLDAAKTTAGIATEPDMSNSDRENSSQVVSNGTIDNGGNETSTSPRTAVTISQDKAIEYLTRTLASVKQFKQELAFVPAHAAANVYPPVAIIYGKSAPTVYGAKVDGREGIKHADAYDELAFASGDGVVLARAAQVPPGYATARGGVVSSERGHVTLLSDLEAVGKCLNAIMKARRRGVGCGS